jgi:hypothetical protein
MAHHESKMEMEEGRTHFDDKAVSSEEGSRQGVEDIVEGVVPGHNRPHNSHRVVLNSGCLVKHLRRHATQRSTAVLLIAICALQ